MSTMVDKLPFGEKSEIPGNMVILYYSSFFQPSVVVLKSKDEPEKCKYKSLTSHLNNLDIPIILFVYSLMLLFISSGPHKCLRR